MLHILVAIMDGSTKSYQDDCIYVNRSHENSVEIWPTPENVCTFSEIKTRPFGLALNSWLALDAASLGDSTTSVSQATLQHGLKHSRRQDAGGKSKNSHLRAAMADSSNDPDDPEYRSCSCSCYVSRVIITIIDGKQMFQRHQGHWLELEFYF